MVQHNYNGVLTKKGIGFILYNQHTEWNLTEELKSYWKRAVPVKIEIESDTGRYLLRQSGDEIYYDKDENGNYKLHINDVNIESVLERAIYKQIYITITTGKETRHGTKNIKS